MRKEFSFGIPLAFSAVDGIAGNPGDLARWVVGNERFEPARE